MLPLLYAKSIVQWEVTKVASSSEIVGVKPRVQILLSPYTTNSLVLDVLDQYDMKRTSALTESSSLRFMLASSHSSIVFAAHKPEGPAQRQAREYERIATKLTCANNEEVEHAGLSVSPTTLSQRTCTRKRTDMLMKDAIRCGAIAALSHGQVGWPGCPAM